MDNIVDECFKLDFSTLLQKGKQFLKLRKELDLLTTKIDFSRFPINFGWRLKPSSFHSGDGFSIYLLYDVKDPFSREDYTLQNFVCYADRVPNLNDFALQVRVAVKEALDHEVDELLFVDGEQRFNPHK